MSCHLILTGRINHDGNSYSLNRANHFCLYHLLYLCCAKRKVWAKEKGFRAKAGAHGKIHGKSSFRDEYD